MWQHQRMAYRAMRAALTSINDGVGVAAIWQHLISGVTRNQQWRQQPAMACVAWYRLWRSWRQRHRAGVTSTTGGSVWPAILRRVRQ